MPRRREPRKTHQDGQPSLSTSVMCGRCGNLVAVPLNESEAACSCGAIASTSAMVSTLAAVALRENVSSVEAQRSGKRLGPPRTAKPKYGNNPALVSADKRSYTDKTLRALLFENGPFCPKCQKELVYVVPRDDQENTNVADICHVLPHGQQGPRAAESTTRKARNLSKNLLVLCKVCHKIVDDDPFTYTGARLLELKANHVAWVKRSLVTAIGRVSFEELDAVTRGLLTTAATPTTNYTSLPPLEKIRRNSLGPSGTARITIGMSRINDVEGFVQQEARRNADFPERLKAGFVAEYERLWNYGVRGDSLFAALHDFSSGGPTTNFERSAAGLAVLTYLFDRCEVFES